MKKVSLINLFFRGAFTELSTVLENKNGEFQYCVNEEDFDHVPILDHLVMKHENVLALQLIAQGAFYDRAVINAFPTLILAVKYHCNSVLYQMIRLKTAQGREELLDFVNMCGPTNVPALEYAIAYKNIDGFRLLLNSGATVTEGAMALAAVNGEEEMLRLMLKQIAGRPNKVALVDHALREVENQRNLFCDSAVLRKIATILTSARDY